jgi:nucleoside-diphosphate-sugar epimerase
MSLHVVLGKGPVGSTLTDRLVDAGHDVRVLSRSGGRSTERVEHVALDAADAAALTAATRGAAVLYNCANPPYDRWVEQWPPVADALLTAAEATGAVLVVMGNLYVYGPVDGPMREDLPLAAPGTKGRVRVAMWEQALARHEAGVLRMTEARASDFVGPRVVATGYLGERAVPRVLAGRAVQHIASPDQPHSWTSVDDVARTLEVLGADERAWGRAWHVPTAPPVTYREAVHGLCRAAGVQPVRVTQLPHLALRAAGLVSPVLRELEETRYQFTRPYVLDSSAVTATFGLEPTPLERTLADTVDWWQSRTPRRTAVTRG